MTYFSPASRDALRWGQKDNPVAAGQHNRHAAPQERWERSFGGDTEDRRWLCSAKLLAGIVLFFQQGIQLHT